MHRHSYSSNGPRLDLHKAPHEDEAIPLQSITTSPQSASSTSRDWQSFEADEMKANVSQHEAAPLLQDSEDGASVEHPNHHGLNPWQLAGLYTSHTLSMWNSRSYEFASILFVASAYPNTMTVASLRGLSSNLASLLLSPAVGRWCNRYPSRLWTLQLCIVLQRICICIACFGWLFIVQAHKTGQHSDHDGLAAQQDDALPIWVKSAIMATLLLLGTLEKLSWVGNLLVMERDWIPLLASPASKPALHVLNASIKRIDLFSKLIAPLAVSAVALGVQSLKVTALLIAATQVVSVGPEMWAAMKVWKSCPALQAPRQGVEVVDSEDYSENSSFARKLATVTVGARRYVGSSVFIPSIASAVLPFSVLSLSGSMTTYLLEVHFPLGLITTARTFSTGVEILSTVLTPLLISGLRGRQRRNAMSNSSDIQPLITVGLLGLLWLACSLLVPVICLAILPNASENTAAMHPILTGLLLVFLALSRLGPFAYILVEQQLVQTAVPADSRVEFSGTEMAIYSFAELSRWGLMGILGKPEQFRFVAFASYATVAISTILFGSWARRWRKKLEVP